MPAILQPFKRRGSAIDLPTLSPLDATAAQLAEDAWRRFSPAVAIDLLAAVPVLGELTTWTLSIVGASKGINLSPFAAGASVKLEWSRDRWSAAGVVLTSGLLLTLTTADGIWRGATGERGGDVILHSRSSDGEIRVSLSRRSLVPGFAIVGLSAYRWNDQTVAYRGRISPVPANQLKRAVNTFVTNATAELRESTQRMVNGSISIAEWQREAAAHVQAVHTAADVAGQGGWQQIKPYDIARIEDTRAGQVDRLNKLAEEVQAETVSDAKAIARTSLFDSSATSLTFEESVRREWEEKAEAGVMVEEANVLGEAEHCEATPALPGCLDETNRGYVPLDTLSRPGRRTCSVNCRCHIVYRRRTTP